jgi:1-acyl-sn-glycerol-3-phosphate acyltransferase
MTANGEPASDSESEPPSSSRRRPQAARLSPQALAAARGGAKEGLDWLGHPPSASAGLLFRLAVLLARVVLFGVFRFRIDASGREHLPSGGFLLVGAVHRGWMDPLLVIHALPLEPRAWFLGSGPSAFSARWREWLIRRLGGMLPVWRGGVGVGQHVASARAVLGAGGVFVLMPEGGVTGPPDRLAPFRVGAALIALRTGAPIVPLAIAGTGELYLGKRMASRILPPTSAAALLGDGWDGMLPAEESREELELARRLTDRFAEFLGPVVTELYPGTVDPPSRRRRWRGLTWLLLARPRS